MSDRVQKLVKWLQGIVFVVSAILSLIGQTKSTEAAATAAAGGFASSGDAASAVTSAGNMQTAGAAGILLSILPFAFQLFGSLRGGKPLAPAWNAVADASALRTLKHITRAGRADDLVHIDALIASGVALETQNRIDEGV